MSDPYVPTLKPCVNCEKLIPPPFTPMTTDYKLICGDCVEKLRERPRSSTGQSK